MRVLTKVFTCTHFREYVVLVWISTLYLFGDYTLHAHGMSLLGRYSCIAQGASPGLVIGIHLLSPVGAALSKRKTNARVIVPLLRSSILLFICVSPGFHIGLCPYFTLGFAGVSPLQGSLSYWAFAVLCRGIMFVKCVWVCKWIVAFVRVFV